MDNYQNQPVLNILKTELHPLPMISPNFGDISIRQVGTDQFDLFITGLTSVGGMPFVLRMRFNNEPTTINIMVASLPVPMIIPPPLDTYPYGIAVNNNGTVLTAMPTTLNEFLRTPLFLATFGADFPETGDSRPIFVPPYKENNNQRPRYNCTGNQHRIFRIMRPRGDEFIRQPGKEQCIHKLDHCVTD